MYPGDRCFAQHDKSLGSTPNAEVRAEDRPCQMEISSRWLSKVCTNMLSTDKKKCKVQVSLGYSRSHLIKQTKDKKCPHQHTFSCGTYHLSNQFCLYVSHSTNWYYSIIFICLSQLVQMIGLHIWVCTETQAGNRILHKALYLNLVAFS